MSRLVLASNNKDKIAEIGAILAGVELVPCAEIMGEVDLPETGATFAENAAEKAKFVAEKTGSPALADDSGLVVPALGGFPGVYSRRFADECGGYPAAFKELDRRLLNRDKSAYFSCVLALALPGGATEVFEGRVNGFLVADSPRGALGFGYDPIFVPNGLGMTFAELDASAKNMISHRAAALALLKKYLAARPLPEEGLAEAFAGVKKPRR